jgi:hypothetical protein
MNKTFFSSVLPADDTSKRPWQWFMLWNSKVHYHVYSRIDSSYTISVVQSFILKFDSVVTQLVRKYTDVEISRQKFGTCSTKDRVVSQAMSDPQTLFPLGSYSCWPSPPPPLIFQLTVFKEDSPPESFMHCFCIQSELHVQSILYFSISLSRLY